MPANKAPSRLARRVPSNERMSPATATLAGPPATPRGASNAPAALFPSASARGAFASPEAAERSAQLPFAFHLRAAFGAESKDASPSSEPRNPTTQDGWTAQDQSPAAEQPATTNHGEPTSAPAPEASQEPAAGGDATAAAPAPSEEPETELPNGGDRDSGATAPESPESGGEASEPAPDEAKSAPPAWGKPEAGASPRSSRRSPVATAVLAAVRSRIASHFPAVLPEQALSRHPFANLASLGDTSPGDTPPGDTSPGEVAPGEVAPGDVEPGDVAPGDVEPVVGETAPAESAADLEPATGEGSAPQADQTTPSAQPPATGPARLAATVEAGPDEQRDSESASDPATATLTQSGTASSAAAVDTQTVPRTADQATPESAEQPQRTASVDDPKISAAISEEITINNLKTSVLPIARKYSYDDDTSADAVEVATVEASSDGLPSETLLGHSGLIGGLPPAPSPESIGPGVAIGTAEGNSRNAGSSQDFSDFSNLRVASKLDVGIGEEAFRIQVRATSAIADGSREINNRYDKVPLVPIRQFSTVYPHPVDKNTYSNLSPRFAESTEVGERVSPVPAVRGSREQAGARQQGLGRSAAAVRAGKVPIAAENVTVRASVASGTPADRSSAPSPGLQEPLTGPESGTSAVHSAAGVSLAGAKTPTGPEASPAAKLQEGTSPPIPGTRQPAVEAASLERNLGVSRLNVILNDERMGRVVVRLSERAGLVEAMVRSENSRTRQVLAGELPALVDSLSRHGLRAAETAMGQESAERGRHFDPREGRSRHQGQQRRSRRGQPGQQQGVFRVRMES